MPKLYFRTAILEPESDVSKTGTVRLSFASETPVLRNDRKRGKYWEKLSHAPGDANLGMLNRNGVLLQDHDDEKEIGIVVRESAKVEADKKTRATVTIEDKEWKTRVSNGDMPGVSVGYVQLSVLREEPDKVDGFSVLVFAWQPYEVSLLNGEPADRSVGINRSKSKKQKRGKKYRCGDCRGTGECPDCDGEGMVDDDGDEAEDGDQKRCMRCRGSGECDECDGEGILEGAKSHERVVDSLKDSNANQILEVLTSEQKKQMRILLKDGETDGGGTKTLTVAEDRKRISEIRSLADAYVTKHGDKLGKDGKKLRDSISGWANTAIESDEDVPAFKARCMEQIIDAKAAEPVRFADITDPKERGKYQYSMMEAVRSCIKNDSRVPKHDTFEGDIHERCLKRWKDNSELGGAGFGYQGFQMPHNTPSIVTRSTMRRMNRDMQATIFAAGGATVPTQLLVPVIELLRNRLVLAWAGIRTLAGLQGNIVIPRQTAPATAYSVAEIAALTASQQTLDQITLIPRRIGATEAYSKQLLFQATPDIESLIRDDLFKVIALQVDYLGINGQGSASQPLGILNAPGVGAITFGATPTYKQIVSMETTIRALNVMGPLAYVSTSNTKGNLKVVAEALTGATTIGGSQNAVWKGIGAAEGEVNGWPAMDSQQIPNNQVIVGDFDDAILGMWGGLDIVVEPYTGAKNAEWNITINTWIDYALRHPQAFCISTDSGAQ